MSSAVAALPSDLEQRILIAAPTRRDGAFSERLLVENGLVAHVCLRSAQLEAEVRRGAAAVVLADTSLDDAAVRALERVLQDAPGWSALPIVMLARQGPPSGPLLRLQRLANVVVLDRPSPSRSFVSATRAAVQARRRQYEMRDLLARLHDSEARLRTFADTAPAVLWVTDGEGAVTFLSRGWKELTGQTEAAGLGWGWLAAVHPDDRERTRAAFQSAHGGREAFTIEHRVQRCEGEAEWVLNVGRPREEVDGRCVGYVGSVLDISAQKRAEHSLREADRHKDEFLATLAHELRNPLAPIRTGLDLLRLGGTLAPPQEKTRAMMERQVTHMVRLIDDLLDVSRITAGKIDLRREAVPIASVLKRAVESSQAFLDAAGVRFSQSLPDEALVVDVDATRIVQVVSNLLHNAAKFTPEGGAVCLSAAREGDTAVVRVTDTGEGIPTELLDRVFDLFQQGPAGGRLSGGLGIGLTLARRLVQLHGGRMEVRSNGPGSGSDFAVHLPLGQSASPVTKDGGEMPVSPARARRVLVVDDNADAAESLAAAIRLLGGTVSTAADGASALAAAEDARPDVIFLDIGLPDMEGYEVCRRLRALPWCQASHIVALTGWGQASDRRLAAEAGFDRHLTKPADFASIRSVFARLPAID